MTNKCLSRKRVVNALYFYQLRNLKLLALDGKGENQGGKPYKTVDTKKKKVRAQKFLFVKRGGSITDRNHASKGRQPQVAWGKKVSAFKGAKVWRKKGS